jgi:hypothetical protein
MQMSDAVVCVKRALAGGPLLITIQRHYTNSSQTAKQILFDMLGEMAISRDMRVRVAYATMGLKSTAHARGT